MHDECVADRDRLQRSRSAACVTECQLVHMYVVQTPFQLLCCVMGRNRRGNGWRVNLKSDLYVRYVVYTYVYLRAEAIVALPSGLGLVLCLSPKRQVSGRYSGAFTAPRTSSTKNAAATAEKKHFFLRRPNPTRRGIALTTQTTKALRTTQGTYVLIVMADTTQ